MISTSVQPQVFAVQGRVRWDRPVAGDLLRLGPANAAGERPQARSPEEQSVHSISLAEAALR